MIRIFLIISLLVLYNIVILSQERNHRDSIDVLNYTINLDFTDMLLKQIKGNTEIRFVPLFDHTSIIKFDFEGLSTDEVKMNGKSLKFIQTPNILSIHTELELTTNDTITLSVVYHGTPKHDKYWGGFFIDKNFAYNYGVGMEASPPNYGRVWYPCIDNFTDRAYYDYYIKTDKNYKAACPGILQSSVSQDDGTIIYHWKLNQSIPSYLSSVAVGDYHIIKDTVKGVERIIPIEIYVNSGQETSARKTFENLKSFFHSFEYRFGPYNWDKIGYVSTPFEQGAMEHATNIAYGQYCNQTSDCESTLAHELSHHWFGNLVTCHSEKDMWLNEGWARYCEAIYYEYKDGSVAYKNQIRNNHFEVLTWVHLNSNSFGSLYGMPHDDTYGRVVYDKGGDIAHTLRGQLGDSLFFSALKAYFKVFAFKDISVSDFKDFLIENTQTDLNAFFEFWIYDKGFPHFSLNNYIIEKKDGLYELKLEIIQQLLNTDKFSKSTKLEIGVLDKDMNMTIFPVVIEGEILTKTLILSFDPIMILIDPNEKVSDATTDEYLILNKKSVFDFNTEYFSLSINQIKKPVFFSITKNWLRPLNKISNPTINKFSNSYWQIQYADNDLFNANGIFYFAPDENFFKSIGSTNLQKIKIFHRSNTKNQWRQLNSELKTQNGKYYFYIDGINNGQYAITSIN